MDWLYERNWIMVDGGGGLEDAIVRYRANPMRQNALSSFVRSCRRRSRPRLEQQTSHLLNAAREDLPTGLQNHGAL